MTRTCLLLVLAIIAAALPAYAKELRIVPTTDLKALVKEVEAGDTIVLGNGDWKDVELKFEQLPGTEAKPITIRAQTSGGVVLTGKTILRVSGEHVIVTGLIFHNPSGVSDVVQLRTHSERHAHHCRLTDCLFEETEDFPVDIESRWLSVYGTRNRIDHCRFVGKKTRGPTFVVWVNDTPQHHRIDHNHFGARPSLGRNGGETIRIGTSDVSELDSQTIVEDNYFHKCDGEAEMISNKSCANVYRHNVFDRCAGTLTLRHGHRCVVDANVFLGRGERGTGGVRIIGKSHTVTNNYMEGLRGDAERAAICMMSGIPNSRLNGYAPVEKAIVTHNTLVDCKVSLEIGVGFGKKQSVAPVNCTISHNLFVVGKWHLIREHATPGNFVWQANKRQRGKLREAPTIDFDVVDVEFTRASDGLLRPNNVTVLQSKVKSLVDHDIDGQRRRTPTICGCDIAGTPFYTWPSEANTGPAWESQAGR